MTTLLKTLFGYHAWANADLLEKLKGVDREKYSNELATALRLISHYYVISKVFAGHLEGVPHGFKSDNLDMTPTLDELQSAVVSSDQWYIDYLTNVPTSSLSERLAFTFTDGDKGLMSREEMLLHVALHATIHRGEVCRILWQLSITPPWDTLAVFLHQSEPHRRLQGN
ncbi:damage-inducible protein DinB [Rhizobium anhuiense]|uniref:DinB family protein n=1 Tax=Rhizobium anhuiense TaxID=1184720 RepID=UPI000BE9C8FE|nr:DinB family protein [Rhizobium anhuiense]PDS34692.1 damage-inducible protein DinB [Rhizobium anhuiense]